MPAFSNTLLIRRLCARGGSTVVKMDNASHSSSPLPPLAA